jgi:hypothetical protein
VAGRLFGRSRNGQWGRPVAVAGFWSLLLISSASFSPSRAFADGLELGIEQSVSGQSNLFRSPTGSIPDGNYEIAPIIRLFGDGERYGYSLEYKPSYEVYFVNEGVNGFDQFFRGNVYFEPAPVSTVRLNADIADYRSVRALAAVGPDGLPDVLPQTTGRINRAFVDLDYEHAVTRSTTATAGAGFQSYAYTTPNNPDSLGFALYSGMTHRLTRDFALGGSLLGSYRRFDELVPQPASQNAVFNANLTALYEPLPSLFIELSAGPAVVFTREDDPAPQLVNRFLGADVPIGPIAVPFVALYQTDPAIPTSCASVGGQFILSTCPVRPVPGFGGSFSEQVFVNFDPSTAAELGDQTVLTGFAEAEIRWEDSWGIASIGYFRGEDASAGIGTTTIRDSVTAAIEFETYWQVDVRVRGNWNQRQATGATNQFTTRAGPSPFQTVSGLFVAEANGLIYTGVATETDITQYWADLRAGKEVYDRLFVELGFRYLKQERIDRPGSFTTSFDNLVGSLMVRYMFEPIEF